MKSLEFTHRQGTAVGMRQGVQPLVKRHEIDMRLQDRDELLIDRAQALCLRPRPIELPEQDGVSRQHRQDNDGEAEHEA
jgi:hypothetical protein